MTPLPAALEAINKAIPATSPEKDLLVAAKCRGLMRGYDARWSDQGKEYRIVEVESLSQGPVLDPETGNRSAFDSAGKVDVKVQDINGRAGIIDHKTTSASDIEKPDAPYWSQLVIESQASHYLLLERHAGRRFGWAHWDVIKKPGISPREMIKADISILAREGTYFGLQARASDTQKALDAISFNAKSKEVITGFQETLSLYEMRLTHECSIENPAKYFQRRSVPRLDREIDAYAQDQWDTAQEMLSSREHNRHPRNSGACMAYGTPCKYLGICTGYSTFEAGGWRQKKSVHSELPVLNGDGRNTLTNSRMATYRLCRRKHFYQYEQGWERIKDEDREALFFGTVIHLALEAWWLAKKDEQGPMELPVMREVKQSEEIDLEVY